MIKKSIVLISMLFIFVSAFSQNIYQDVVYLKNGSIIRGMIIEQIPSQSLKIETADSNLFVFQMNEIEKITKEITKSEVKEIIPQTEYMKSGYRGFIEMGNGLDFGLLYKIKVHTVHGYQFNPYLSLGIGTGIDFYSKRDNLFIPVFANIRVNFIDYKVTPYVSTDFGYSFSGKYDNIGGLYFNTAIGLSFKTSRKTAINISSSFDLQYCELKGDYYYPNYDYNNRILSFNFGFSF
ncbi:MAG: hypothetical protein LBN27_05265 [Prevotellaceae bacterium]|jgi:hypothetical protein|nr:hypothetical protein [Prevotellaceae bacterium]